MLTGKKIIVGVSGSIAAYKSATLVRLLVKAGAQVKVVMTNSAKDFITPLTLATLSKQAVVSSFTSNEEEGTWNNHVDLGLWADLIVIAPATAKTISAMSSGYCDNVLQAVYLSAKCPVMVAPAMDLDMYQHFSTRQNISTLTKHGVIFIAPNKGELASGLFGQGRMVEPEEIENLIIQFFNAELPLKGKKVLITAGPTYEAIDPVRFIGNHSSGKMGVCLAEEALKLGAEVTLICGPSAIQSSIKINRINVTSAAEMLKVTLSYFDDCDVAIMSAAVADYTPETTSTHKLKKTNNQLEIKLKPTVDILKTLGDKKRKQLLVGFALETDNELENAKEKRVRKNADFIVLNSLNDKNAGFGYDTNQVQIIDSNNKVTSTGLVSKKEAASQIFNVILPSIHD
jgi:phosphopantothenoylcysteine decarboxylase/phosphopantothenate--cysteine ligase